MAIASCSVTVISRGKGRSAVAAAAYRAGQEMSNAYDGLVHNYTRKSGIIYKDILTPTGAPDWAQDRQKLWNMVEQTECRKDAQLAREVMIALPQELSPRQNIDLARDYAQKFVEQGMIADVSVHDSQDGNPHAHILLTLRPLEGDNFGKKCREWNAKEKLIEWREQYADLTNQYLERYGHDQRIDARSYADQGIDQIPTIHLGPHAYRMEQRGIPSDRGDINREIERDNQQIREIVKQIALLEQERQCLKFTGYSFIENYKKTQEELRSVVQALTHRLTEKGRDILIQQQTNIENAIQNPQRPIPEQEPPAHQNRLSSPGRQFGFDEQQPRLQEEPSHLKRPPPLRRHHEERHLALERRNTQERLRQRPQEHQMPDYHALTEQTERRRKADYDRLYEEPISQAQEPKHHSRIPSRKRGRQTDYNRLYEEPTDTERRQERSPPDDDRDR